MVLITSFVSVLTPLLLHPVACAFFSLAFSDDLSGATDAGGEFLQAGLDARALLYTESSVRCDALGDCDVLIVDTDSRSVDIPHALLNLRSASHRLENVEALVYYKKIDSTVRGNLAAVGLSIGLHARADRQTDVVVPRRAVRRMDGQMYGRTE